MKLVLDCDIRSGRTFVSLQAITFVAILYNTLVRATGPQFFILSFAYIAFDRQQSTVCLKKLTRNIFRLISKKNKITTTGVSLAVMKIAYIPLLLALEA